MRKILLMTILTVGFYLPTYAQFDSRLQNNRLWIDTTFKSLSLKNNLKTPSLWENKDLGGSFYDPIPGRKYHFPKLSDKKIKIGKDLFAINKTTTTFDNMPCFKPQGFCPMPIFVPDSTVRYTLLIKR